MKLIAAIDKNWNIGKDGELLVHIPEDMKFFREKTMGKVVVMGRKTLESFPGGKPLKGRTNIVLTRDRNYMAGQNCRVTDTAAAVHGSQPSDTAAAAQSSQPDDAGAAMQNRQPGHTSAIIQSPQPNAAVIIVNSLEELTEVLKAYDRNDIFVIGGGSIYRQLLPLCDTAYITKVNVSCEADTSIPNLDEDPAWIARYIRKGGVHNGMEYNFCTYLRRKNSKKNTGGTYYGC